MSPADEQARGRADRHALDVEVSIAERDTCVVRCAGTVDIGNAPRFREVVAGALRAGRRRMIIDLCGVTFIDSAGVGVIVGARDHMQRGARLFVRAGDERIRTLLAMAGLGEARRAARGAPGLA